MVQMDLEFGLVTVDRRMVLDALLDSLLNNDIFIALGVIHVELGMIN